MKAQLGQEAQNVALERLAQVTQQRSPLTANPLQALVRPIVAKK